MEENRNPIPEPEPGLIARGRELIFGGSILLLAIALCNFVFYGGCHLAFGLVAAAMILASWLYLCKSGHRFGGYEKALLILSLVICAGFGRSDDRFVKFVMLLFLFVAVNLALCIGTGQNRRNPQGAMSLLLCGCGNETPNQTEIQTQPQETAAPTVETENSGEGEGVLDPETQLIYCLVKMIVTNDEGQELWGREYSYDDTGFCTWEREYSNIGSAAYSRVNSPDVLGRIGSSLFTELDGSQYTVVYTYDEFDRCLREDLTREAGTKEYTEYTYNDQGNYLTLKQYIDGQLIMDYSFSYTYDGQGRQVSMDEYLSGGLSGILPEGYTLAEYARRGFFEMAWLCCLNLGILCFSIYLIRQEQLPRLTKIAGTFLAAVTIFLVLTASAKMVMYIGSYGLTRRRVLTEIIMLWLALTTILVTLRLYRPNFGYMKAVILTAMVLGALVFWVDVDSVVGRYNVRAYQSGRLETIDVSHLDSLGSAGVPWLVELTGDENPVVAREAWVLLESRDKYSYLYEIEDFRGWNFIRSKGNEALDAWIEARK